MTTITIRDENTGEHITLKMQKCDLADVIGALGRYTDAVILDHERMTGQAHCCNCHQSLSGAALAQNRPTLCADCARKRADAAIPQLGAIVPGFDLICS